jgi:hypothetical protein
MATLTDPFKQVLFNDGEEITFGDLNDSQNFDDAMLTDQILESLAGDFNLAATDPNYPANSAGSGNVATHLAYCLKGGSAYLRLGAANNKLRINAGTLFQKIASKTGNTSTFLPYYFDGSTTYEFTIAAGPGSNYRIDLCQMSLAMANQDTQTRDFKDATTGAITSQSMSKKRQVTCTLSVKSSAVSATPTVPDPDAGCVAVAFVVVGPAYSTATALDFTNYGGGAQASVYDVRMPMQVKAIDTILHAGVCISAWSVVTSGGQGPIIQSSSTINSAKIPIGPGDSCSRLIGLYLKKDTTAWSNTTGLQVLCSNAIQTISQVFTTNASVLVPYYTIEAQATATTPTITPSTTNKIGPAVWSGFGRCASPRVNADASYRYPYASIATGNNASQLQHLVAYWAG